MKKISVREVLDSVKTDLHKKGFNINAGIENILFEYLEKVLSMGVREPKEIEQELMCLLTQGITFNERFFNDEQFKNAVCKEVKEIVDQE